MIHRLIPNRDDIDKISKKERFYLLASAWLHDLGMLRSVAELVCNEEELEHDNMRKLHHIISGRFIVEHFERCGVREIDKDCIAKICFYHSRKADISNCEEFSIVGNNKIRLNLLAAYLRLADALHIDSSRTPSHAYAVCLTYNIPSDSKLFWIKSQLVNGVDIDRDNHLITIEFKKPYKKDLIGKIDLDWASRKLNRINKIIIDDLKEELFSVLNILVRKGPTYYLDIVITQYPVE